MRLISSMALAPFKLGKVLAKTSSVAAIESHDNSLWVCEVCFKQGHHSPLHQLTWLTRCYIHGIKLTRISSDVPQLGSGMPSDARHVRSIHEYWFKPDSGHAVSSEALLGIPDNHLTAWKCAADLRKLLSLGEKRLARLEAAKSLPIVRGDTAADRLELALRAVSGDAGNRTLSRLFSGRRPSMRLAIASSPNASIAALSIDRHEDLLKARALECIVRGEAPPWVQALNRAREMLLMGHEKCVEEVKTVEPLVVDALSSDGRTEMPTPCVAIVKRGLSPCAHVVLIEQLDLALNPLSALRELSDHLFSTDPYDTLCSSHSGVHHVDAAVRVGEFSLFALDTAGHPKRIRRSRQRFDLSADRGRFLVPRGPLAKVIDYWLLARAWSKIWACHDLIARCHELVWSDHLGPPGAALEYRLRQTEPSVAVDASGGFLRIKLHCRVPARQPRLGVEVSSAPPLGHRSVARSAVEGILEAIQRDRVRYEMLMNSALGGMRLPL